MRSDDATPGAGVGAQRAAEGRAVYQTRPAIPARAAGAVLLAACAGAPPDAAPLHRFARSAAHMGTRVSIVVYAPDEAVAERALRAAFARVAAVDAAMSDYDPDSELSRLARDAVGAPVPVSEDLFAVLWLAQRVSAASDGAFDVTVGPVVALWRRARRQLELPDAARLGRARAAVGWRGVRLDARSRTAELAARGMSLDLGGIAKGYAAQVALDALCEHGTPRALVDAGGDLALGDPPPGETGWLVGLAPPRAGAAPESAIRVARCAVATSGDLFRFVEIDGVRYAHIVDPRTGLGLTGRREATVVAPDGALADALASAACVLPAERALAVVGSFAGASVLVRSGDDGGVREVVGPGFPARLQRPAAR